MKNTFFSLLSIIAILVTSCNNNNQKKTTDVDKESITISHELGETNVPVQPKKVVVFDMGMLETLKEFNIPIAGMPKDFVPTHLESFKNDTTILDAGSVLAPNLELVSAIRPDLIIISALQAKDYDDLKQIAPTIYLGIDNNDFKNSAQRNMENLGKIFGIEDAVAKKTEEINNKIEEAANIISQSPSKIMILLYNNGTFSTFGSKSRYGFVYNDLKAVPVDDNKEASIHGTVVSSEYISEHNPDVLYVIDRNLIIDKNKPNTKEIENLLVQKTNAFKNKRIVYLDPNIWYLSGGGSYSIQKMVDEILQGYK